MRRSLVVALGALLWAGSAEAQTLSDQVGRLFQFGSCGDPVCLNVGGVHGSHFNPSVTQGTENMIGFLTNSIGRTISSFPISATSSGTTFNQVGGALVPTSTSAGPIFAERAQTMGKGAFLVGANVSSFSFESLRGQTLNNLTFRFAHENVGAPAMGDPDFENDIIDVTLDMRVQSLVSSFFMTWGVFSKFDVSVAVPVIRAQVSGSSIAEVIPFANGQLGTPHRFDGAAEELTARTSVSESASGIGDVALRGKLNISQTRTSGFSILADVRLPTGKEQDFLGTGELAVRGLAIFSASIGDFAPHVNAGYVGRGGQLLNDGFLATVGFDQRVTNWFTLAIDVLSEFQVGDNNIVLPAAVTFTEPEVRTLDLAPFPDTKDDIVDFSAGAKLSPMDGLQFVTNILIPMNKSRGLRTNLAWTAGLEYRFGSR